MSLCRSKAGESSCCGRARPPLPTDLPWLIDPVRQVHIRQDVDGRALVGGFLGKDETVDPSAFDHDADPDWIATVLEQTAQNFGIEIDRSSVIDSWAGLYPSTPDQHPIIDRTDADLRRCRRVRRPRTDARSGCRTARRGVDTGWPDQLP
ncbi:MAG: FAD-binding oxidoreductase [Chloroflexi bacterium]|nr:FAD-binding oxidoreductase [Chloroflexota bacterium]